MGHLGEKLASRGPAGEGTPSRLATLNAVTWLITSRGVDAGTFHLIASELFASLTSRFLALARANDEADAFDVVYGDAYGHPELSRPRHVFDRWRSAYGWVFDHRSPLLLPDIRDTPQFPENRSMAANGVRARMIAPLVCGDETLGVLALSSSEAHAFTPEDAEFLEIVAGAIALGLRNRDLLERTALLESLVGPERMRCGDLSIDLAGASVRVRGEEVALTPTEYHILAALVRHSGQILTADTLLERVWGPAYAGEHYLVRLFVSRLRRKLGDDPRRPRYIETKPGFGYRFPPSAGDRDTAT
jgi:DNA-binding winged helix-turn-helix (wHTH) protein